MTQFLLELRSEEIPARMQVGARRDFEKLFREQMAAAGVALGALTVWSTPRRLALIAHDLPLATAAVSEEVKGPKVGAPPQALEGFLRKTGLTQDQLTERDGVFFAISEKPGRATRDVLAEAIPAIIRAFPWPKSQRWGAGSISTESLRWVRPLSGIVALLGQELVECEVGDIRSGYATMGHRFHHPGEITIGSAADYQDKLRACHVIADHAEREALIREQAKAAATAAGLVLVEDEGLVIENAGLTEWPVPLLGRFDEAYLEVPPEVIQLTARTNQKYFVCTFPPQSQIGEGDHAQHGGGVSSAANTPPPSSGGSPSPSAMGRKGLANAFVCTANIVASDGGEAIVAGNRKVLAARLSDARFFWEQDRKQTLAEHAEGLARITFHEKLGTVADKVKRVTELARWLVQSDIVRPKEITSQAKTELYNNVGAAASLCKADLVTEMVGEFPELQGLMGGYYARAEGLPDAVADAIRDHYKPVGQGDDVPTAPVTVAVSLADKLDTLICFFAVKEKPTGSKDPFALRRAIIGILDLIISNHIRIAIRHLSSEGYRVFVNQLTENNYVIPQDYNPDKENNWGRLLRGSAAYVDLGKELLVLNDEPPANASDNDEDGIEVWDPWEMRRRGLVNYQVSGFVDVVNEATEFTFDRLRDREKRAGRRPDLISAVLPSDWKNVLEGLGIGDEWIKFPNVTSDDDVVRILNLGETLQAFITTPDGANLLAGYKRAANILKKEEFQPGAVNPAPEPAEAALIAALDAAAPAAQAAVEAEDFAAAMAALASLRAPIDVFFDDVTVNDADPKKRAARLGLLDRFCVAVHNVADFSKIEG